MRLRHTAAIGGARSVATSRASGKWPSSARVRLPVPQPNSRIMDGCAIAAIAPASSDRDACLDARGAVIGRRRRPEMPRDLLLAFAHDRISRAMSAACVRGKAWPPGSHVISESLNAISVIAAGTMASSLPAIKRVGLARDRQIFALVPGGEMVEPLGQRGGVRRADRDRPLRHVSRSPPERYGYR